MRGHGDGEDAVPERGRPRVLQRGRRGRGRRRRGRERSRRRKSWFFFFDLSFFFFFRFLRFPFPTEEGKDEGVALPDPLPALRRDHGALGGDGGRVRSQGEEGEEGGKGLELSFCFAPPPPPPPPPLSLSFPLSPLPVRGAPPPRLFRRGRRGCFFRGGPVASPPLCAFDLARAFRRGDGGDGAAGGRRRGEAAEGQGEGEGGKGGGEEEERRKWRWSGRLKKVKKKRKTGIQKELLCTKNRNRKIQGIVQFIKIKDEMSKRDNERDIKRKRERERRRERKQKVHFFKHLPSFITHLWRASRGWRRSLWLSCLCGKWGSGGGSGKRKRKEFFAIFRRRRASERKKTKER